MFFRVRRSEHYSNALRILANEIWSVFSSADKLRSSGSVSSSGTINHTGWPKVLGYPTSAGLLGSDVFHLIPSIFLLLSQVPQAIEKVPLLKTTASTGNFLCATSCGLII